MAVSDLDYWTNTRGIAKEKLSLGVPFYGYGFGAGAPADINFKDLVKQYPGAENTDEVTVAGGGIIYYNGIPTIKNKTMLALQNAGGVMIWQLMGDDPGNKSLLNVINTTINAAK
jgi:GH18 family chitinase